MKEFSCLVTVHDSNKFMHWKLNILPLKLRRLEKEKKIFAAFLMYLKKERPKPDIYKITS